MAADAVPISEQQHIVKDGVDFWRGLQEADHSGQAHDMGGVGQEFGHAVGGSTVQACADLVHQQHALQTCNQSSGMELRAQQTVFCRSRPSDEEPWLR